MSYCLGSSAGSFAKGTLVKCSVGRSCRGEPGVERRVVCLASPPRKYKPRGLQAALEHTLPPAEFTLPNSDAPVQADGARSASRARMATAATTGAVGTLTWVSYFAVHCIAKCGSASTSVC